jgi:hypothetical protein
MVSAAVLRSASSVTKALPKKPFAACCQLAAIPSGLMSLSKK